MINDDVIAGTGLRFRADGIVAELGRLTDAWRDGRAPSPAELDGLIDEVEALRGDLAGRSGAVRQGSAR